MPQVTPHEAPSRTAPPAPAPAGEGVQPAKHRVLVCAPRAGDDPVVVLADGSYERGPERVFWRSRPESEVLRLPLDAPVSERPLRPPPVAVGPTDGETALLRAVRRHLAKAVPSPRPTDDARQEVPPAACSLTDDLRAALLTGDDLAARAAAEVLRVADSVAAVHAAIVSTLHEVGSQWAAGRSSILTERRATAAAHSVVVHLQHTTAPPTGSGSVVLAAPVGDRHRLGLEALAQLLAAHGRPTLVVEDLPLPELGALAAERSTGAVVISAHLPLSHSDARRTVNAIRAAAPDVLIAVGGPGSPDGRSCGADLVSSSVEDLLHALDSHNSGLTRRECEVLLAVADGHTNRQIAELLGLSPATVKSHLDRVLAKTGTEHRSAAVARALREGWIT